jgi:hypothetical protein
MTSQPGEHQPPSSVTPPGITRDAAGGSGRGGTTPAGSATSAGPSGNPGPDGTASAGTARDSLLWALAALPIALTAIDMVLVRGFGIDPVMGLHVGSGASAGLVIADWRALRDRVSRPWLMVIVSVLLTPAYLFWRCRATGRSQAPLLVWVAALVLTVAVSVAAMPAATGGEIDTAALEARIEEALTAEVGPPGVEATCPTGQPAEEGHTFTCEAEHDSEVVPVVVVVENEQGDLRWRPDPSPPAEV